MVAVARMVSAIAVDEIVPDTVPFQAPEPNRDCNASELSAGRA